MTDGRASVPAGELLAGFVERVKPALEALGEYRTVSEALARLSDHGNGAMRQLCAWRRRHEVADVIAAAAAATFS